MHVCWPVLAVVQHTNEVRLLHLFTRHSIGIALAYETEYRKAVVPTWFSDVETRLILFYNILR